MSEIKEGWSYDVTVRSKTHYYKNGKSLCGKAKVKKHMDSFDKDRIGSKWFCDCMVCVKKQIEALHEDPLCCKKTY